MDLDQPSKGSERLGRIRTGEASILWSVRYGRGPPDPESGCLWER